jgi:N6-L-threonylcarbamoyladenine synthase
MKGNATDFSFSGLKTAVLRWFEARDLSAEVESRRRLWRQNPRPPIEAWLEVTPKPTLDLLASFQHSVIEEIMRRIRSTSEEIDARTVIVSGGVACNRGLREAAVHMQIGARILFPAPGLSTDNAAMIGAAAFPKFDRGEFSDFSLGAKASLPLA